MYASVIIYTLAALSGVMSSLAPEPEVMPRAIAPRTPSMADIPFPRFPSLNSHYNDKRHYDNGHYDKGHNDKGHNDKGHNDKGHNDKGHDDGKGCDTNTGTNNQTNACSAGNPYCCSASNSGGHVCANTTACDQKVICCNNQNGFQICIGEIDFNAPVTINYIYE
ncbi:hydrophobin 1 [Trichoderma evansii]